MNEDPSRALYDKAAKMLSEGDLDGVEVMREAAEMGCPYAQNDYANILMTGDLVYRDIEGAFKWYCLAAERGMDESQFFLGLAYYDGVIVEKDLREAVKWFRVAAEKGYPQAQHYMGICYYNGEGVYRDFDSAVRWFTMASDRGLSSARISLADVYSDLHNPNRNYKNAFRLYKLASDAGDVKGHYKLGMCYYTGKGTPRNYIEASKCFRKGVDPHRDPECEFMLAMMYTKGEGVQKNRNYANALLFHAAESGNEDAKRYFAKSMGDSHSQQFSQTSEPEIEILNTPDVIAGLKGANSGRKLFFQFRKKNV